MKGNGTKMNFMGGVRCIMTVLLTSVKPLTMKPSKIMNHIGSTTMVILF